MLRAGPLPARRVSGAQNVTTASGVRSASSVTASPPAGTTLAPEKLAFLAYLRDLAQDLLVYVRDYEPLRGRDKALQALANARDLEKNIDIVNSVAYQVQQSVARGEIAETPQLSEALEQVSLAWEARKNSRHGSALHGLFKALAADSDAGPVSVGDAAEAGGN